MDVMMPRTNFPAPFFLNKSQLRTYPVVIDFLCDNRISDKHWHDYIQIWYTISGSYLLTINGVTQKQVAGAISIIPPFAVHQIDSSQSNLSELRVVKAQFAFDVFTKNQLNLRPLDFLFSAFDNTRLSPFMKLSGKNKDIADILFYDMLALFFSGRKENSAKIFVLLNNVLEYCTKNEPSLSKKEIVDKYERANCINNSVSFLTSNYSKKITIDEARKYALMSRRSFIEHFKETTGTTCHEYLTSLRIENAISKLRFGEKNMSEISYECGFASSSHFSQTISSTFGLSPSDLKKALNQWDYIYKNRQFLQRAELYTSTGRISYD